MTATTEESRRSIITDLELEGRSFLTAAYWRAVVDRGLDAVYRAYVDDVQTALGDWSHVCRLQRSAELYTVRVYDRTLRLPRTGWETLNLDLAGERRDQLLAQTYESAVDSKGDRTVFDVSPTLAKPEPTIHNREVPNWTSVLTAGEFTIETDTVVGVDVPRERVVTRLAEALALNPAALAELEALCELDERLDGPAVQFVE